MKYLLICISVLAVAWLAGCESLVNTIPEDKLPQGDPLITMFCYISPQDTVIRAKVGMSNPAFGVHYSNGKSFHFVDGDTVFTGQPLTTAQVSISDGEATARLRYQAPSQVFELSVKEFPIRAGRTYTLTVTDGAKSARATCTVPARSVPVKGYTLDSIETNRFGNDSKVLEVDFTWDDPAGEVNFYRVDAYEVIDAPLLNFNPADSSVTETRRTFTNFFRIDRNNFRSVYQSDKNIDGTTFSSPVFQNNSLGLANYSTLITINGRAILPKRGPERVGVFLKLFNTDQPYFDFHRSLEAYQNDNPFTEPSLLYTNVQGGLGVFASYNQSVRVIKF